MRLHNIHQHFIIKTWSLVLSFHFISILLTMIRAAYFSNQLTIKWFHERWVSTSDVRNVLKSYLGNTMFVLLSSILFVCLLSGTAKHPNRLHYFEGRWIERFVLECLRTPPNTVVEVAFVSKWLAFKAAFAEMFTQTLKISEWRGSGVRG